jgi:thiamine-monophosphate kinase
VTARITVADLGERALVERIRACVGTGPSWVRIGIGDDAAVIEPPKRMLDVVTTDALVEHVHFDRAFSRPGDIGAKALAVNLSDLAAMGASPRVAVLSLGLPAQFLLEDFDNLVDGFARFAAAHRVALVGGNITRSTGPLFVGVTAIGAVHSRKMLTRGGGRPGDALYVSGRPGAAAAGLAWLRARGARSEVTPPNETVADAVTRYTRPDPRVRLGTLVGRARAASACIDLSDGLAASVRQLAQACGAGAIVEASAVPWHPSVHMVWPDAADGLTAAMGGDDYELLFAVPGRRRRAFEAVACRRDGPLVTRIGRLTKETEIVMQRGEDGVALPAGYAHFAK